MKRLTKIFSFSLALSLLAGAAIAFAHKESKQAIEVEAATHAENYDPYKYSGSYYSTISDSLTQGKEGTLRQALTSLINPPSVPSYSSGLSTHLQQADEDPTNSSNMVFLYTRNSVTKQAAGTWNREHVWPKSDSNGCWETSRAGADMLHLRPTYSTTNSKRSNYLYGNISGSSLLSYNGMPYGYQSGNYFMPLDTVKGDVARICMYIWVAYHDEYGSKLPALTNVFQSVDVLMEWHTQDKPDAMEGNRNNYAQSSMQRNRNPFVDHPEYAWEIFGSDCSASVLNAAKAAYPADGSGGGDPTPVTGSVVLSETSKTITVGESFQLTGTSSNGANITWSTTNSSVTLSSNTSSSGSAITVYGNSEGTVDVYGSITIDGTQFKSKCSVTVNEGSGGGDDPGPIDTTTVTLTPDDFGTYTAGVSNSDFASSNVGTYSSSIQFKNGQGILYNTKAYTNIQSISINIKSGSNRLTVYVGTYVEPSGTVISGTESGSTVTYDFSDYSYPYFRMVNGSGGTTNLNSITITYGTSGGSGGGDDPVDTLVGLSLEDYTTEYTVGDTFSFDGYAFAVYSITGDIGVTPTYVSSPNMSVAGTKVVTVGYSDGSNYVETSYQIHVSAAEPTLLYIYFDTPSIVSSYNVGDTFVKPTVYAHYDIGDDVDVTNLVTFTGYDMNEPGIQTVTATFVDKDDSFHIEVVQPDPVTSLTVTGGKTFFYVGESFTGAYVNATFESGKVEDVTGGATYTGYDLSQEGIQTITVSYGGQSTTYEIHVIILKSLTIEGSVKTEYAVGEDFEKPTIIAHYSENLTDDVTNKATFINASTTSSGTYVVTVSYSDHGVNVSITYQITVKTQVTPPPAPTKKLTNIDVNVSKNHFDVGDQFVKAGVSAYYSDDTSKDVSSEAVFTGYNMNLAAKQKVTVSYTEEDITVNITYTIYVVAKESITPTTDTSTASSDSIQVGCGGNIATMSIILSTISLVGIGLILLKKKKAK